MSYKIIKILFLKGVKAQRYNNALDKNDVGSSHTLPAVAKSATCRIFHC